MRSTAHDGRSKDSDVNAEIPIKPQVGVEKGSRNGGNMRTVAFLLGALAGSAAMPSRRRIRADLDVTPMRLRAASAPAIAVGTFALGSLALGAFAVGALAIGALAVGKLEIRKARLREVEIDSLTVRRFSIADEDTPEESAKL
jgi:hypothetical protein